MLLTRIWRARRVAGAFIKTADLAHKVRLLQMNMFGKADNTKQRHFLNFHIFLMGRERFFAEPYIHGIYKTDDRTFRSTLLTNASAAYSWWVINDADHRFRDLSVRNSILLLLGYHGRKSIVNLIEFNTFTKLRSLMIS